MKADPASDPASPPGLAVTAMHVRVAPHMAAAAVREEVWEFLTRVR